jgi:hypothetical protein
MSTTTQPLLESIDLSDLAGVSGGCHKKKSCPPPAAPPAPPPSAGPEITTNVQISGYGSTTGYGQ